MGLIRCHNFHVAFTIDLRSYENTGPGFRERRRAALAYLVQHLPDTLVRFEYDAPRRLVHIELIAEKQGAGDHDTRPLDAIQDRWRSELGRFLESLPIEVDGDRLPTIPAAPAEGGA